MAWNDFIISARHTAVMAAFSSSPSSFDLIGRWKLSRWKKPRWISGHYVDGLDIKRQLPEGFPEPEVMLPPHMAPLIAQVRPYVRHYVEFEKWKAARRILQSRSYQSEPLWWLLGLLFQGLTPQGRVSLAMKRARERDEVEQAAVKTENSYLERFSAVLSDPITLESYQNATRYLLNDLPSLNRVYFKRAAFPLRWVDRHFHVRPPMSVRRGLILSDQAQNQWATADFQRYIRSLSTEQQALYQEAVLRADEEFNTLQTRIEASGGPQPLPMPPMIPIDMPGLGDVLPQIPTAPTGKRDSSTPPVPGIFSPLYNLHSNQWPRGYRDSREWKERNAQDRRDWERGRSDIKPDLW